MGQRRSYQITLSYDGTHYAGWQVQPEAVTIQQLFEEAVTRVTGEKARATASGRTDAGVHALGQVVSIDLTTALSCYRLQQAWNAHLPDDIRVVSVATAPSGFHAIRDAIGKRYRYNIQDGATIDLFQRRYAWQLRERLDVDAMQVASRYWIGQHDFASFQGSGSPRATTVRTITEFVLERRVTETGELLACEVAADGFLYNMVRNLIGTLVEIGRGKRPAEWAHTVLRARDRVVAGPTAPPHGLFLVEVNYPSEIMKDSPFVP